MASNRYHGDDTLTYESEVSLTIGQIVSVPMQRQQVVGVIQDILSVKPEFATKPIAKIISETPLPKQLLDLVRWLKEYYPASLGSLLQLLLPTTLQQTSRTAYQPKVAKHLPLPPLTAEQQAVIQQFAKRYRHDIATC